MCCPPVVHIGQFCLKSRHGGNDWGHLQSYTSGEIHASRRDVGSEESWNVYKVGDLVALRNCRTGRFLRGGADGDVKCDRSHCDTHERWRVEEGLRADTVALRSCHGKCLRLQPGGRDTRWGGEVAADADAIGDWESSIVLHITPHGWPQRPASTCWGMGSRLVVAFLLQCSCTYLSIPGYRKEGADAGGLPVPFPTPPHFSPPLPVPAPATPTPFPGWFWRQ
jgi:hypothetical protein